MFIVTNEVVSNERYYNLKSVVSSTLSVTQVNTALKVKQVLKLVSLSCKCNYIILQVSHILRLQD